mmetsp:Transcript_3774/g.9133  ORF Transcript_3774/g.9133 Transcript_3774/m.9133 type:complete len:227 (-) Transcript_3774:36-716(-)
MLHGEGLTDGHTLTVARANLDLVVGTAVTVETHLEAFHNKCLGLVQAEVSLPFIAQDGHGKVGAKARCDVVLFEECALVVNEGKLSRAILLLSDHHELVVQGIELAAAVVHHPANVGRVLMRTHLATILKEVILIVKLIQKLADVLEIAILTAGTYQREVPDLLHTAHILVPCLRAVRGKRVSCDQHATVVLQPNDRGTSDDRLQGVLLGVGGVLTRRHRGSGGEG